MRASTSELGDSVQPVTRADFGGRCRVAVLEARQTVPPLPGAPAGHRRQSWVTSSPPWRVRRLGPDRSVPRRLPCVSQDVQQRLGLCRRQRHCPLGDDNQGAPRKGKAAPSSLTGLNRYLGVWVFKNFFNCWFGNNFDPQKTQATQAPARLLRSVPGCRRLGPLTCPLDPLPACAATWRSAWTIAEQVAFLLCP